MDSIGKLVLFRDVIEQGGFSHAASHRGLSHSTVSKHMKTLEAELGVLLMNRTSRSINLTEEGRLVYDYSRRVGGEVEELMHRLDELRGEISSELHVSCQHHLSRPLVQPAIARFVRQYPDTRVKLTLGDPPRHLSQEGIDIAVRVGLHAERSVTARELSSNAVCFAASAAWVEQHGMPSHPSELATVPTVIQESNGLERTTWSYIDGGQVRTVRVDPVCRVTDGAALTDAVRVGLGLGCLSWISAHELLASGELVQVLADVPLPPDEPVYVIHSDVEHVTPGLEAFKRHLVTVATMLEPTTGSSSTA